MSRKTATITRRDVNAALSAITKKDAAPYEIGDDKCSGLSLRVRARSASWALRGRFGGKQSTWTVAPVRPGDDPAEMRERAHEAKSLLKRGIDPKAWLQETSLGGQIERHFDEERDGWTWERARDAFLTFVEAERSKATFNDYRKTLNAGDLDRLHGRLVKSITKRDVASIQDAIYARGVPKMAVHTLRILKACLNWTAQRAASGLDDSPAVSVKPLSINKNTASRYVPTLEDLGKAPWLLDAARTNPAARLACMIALLTGQRRETIVSARKDAFKEVEGGGIWTIPPAHMKSKRQHVLPLPSIAWSVTRAAMALGRSDSPWLFPQLRLRRKGDAGDGYMSAKELNDAFLNAGSPIRPHDCRRAFATHGEALLGFKRSDTKAILDHAEGQSGDVTAAHYALHDGTHFKWLIMRTWEAFVLEQIEAQKPSDNKNRLPGFLL